MSGYAPRLYIFTSLLREVFDKTDDLGGHLSDRLRPSLDVRVCFMVMHMTEGPGKI